VTNISYFAPAYYRVFGELTDNVDGWNAAVDRSYEIVSLSLSEAQGNAENGLVPAWCDSRGVPVEAFGGAPTHFQNDSTRTPFRIGQDYCYFGEPRALEYMKKITSFYTAVGVENIVDGYELDGTPRPDFSMNGLQPASFIGPAGVGALYSAENQEFINAAYAALATGELTAGTIYYQKSWSALSLLMMTGNFTVLPAP
jgi:endoglucanase